MFLVHVKVRNIKCYTDLLEFSVKNDDLIYYIGLKNKNIFDKIKLGNCYIFKIERYFDTIYITKLLYGTSEGILYNL